MAIQHVFLLLLVCALAEVYEKTNPNVFFLNSQNFDKHVTKKRDKHVSIVHFYRERDGKSKEWAEEINELAKDWQGVYNIAVVNCGANEGLCESQEVKTTPTIKVYPPFPAPIQIYDGETSAKSLNNYSSRFVNSFVVELTEENYATFLNEKPSMPKVMLFTEKSGTPTLFKSLSLHFENKMLFGVAKPEDTSLVAKFKVKTYPKIVLYKTSDNKSYDYSGDLKFRGIFDWLNVYAETFVSGGTDAVLSVKPWMNQVVPQLTKQSADDICYKHEGFLCAILFLESAPDDSLTTIIKSLSDKYGSKKERGADVKFMWLDINTDRGYFESFEGTSVGQLVFLKHGKRNRYVAHDGKVNLAEVSNTIDKIGGGDGKFMNIKGGLPELNMQKK